MCGGDSFSEQVWNSTGEIRWQMSSDFICQAFGKGSKLDAQLGEGDVSYTQRQNWNFAGDATRQACNDSPNVFFNPRFGIFISYGLFLCLSLTWR